jgi:hypothetical protein
MGKHLIWTAIAAAVAIAGALTVIFALLLPGAGLSIHGWIAVGIGVVLASLLGFGLMFLVFHSSRQGYDEAAQGPDRPTPEK